MGTLASIFAEQNDILNALIESDGALSQELEARLNSIQVELPEKVDGYYLFLERLESESAFFKKRSDEFRAAQKAIDGAYQRLKEHLKHHMISESLGTLCGSDYRFDLSKSKPSVIITNEDLIPKEYCQEVVTKTIDRARILQDLSLGIPVEGAHLHESFALRSGVFKQTKRVKGKSDENK